MGPMTNSDNCMQQGMAMLNLLIKRDYYEKNEH